MMHSGMSFQTTLFLILFVRRYLEYEILFVKVLMCPHGQLQIDVLLK